jgi:hypothetical protein
MKCENDLEEDMVQTLIQLNIILGNTQSLHELSNSLYIISEHLEQPQRRK